MSELVETVSRKPIPAHVKDIVFEAMVDDDTGEDVEVSRAFDLSLSLVVGSQLRKRAPFIRFHTSRYE